jgi:hypothetical protein
MIISHEHEFIFVKTEKTAGTSMEVYLSNHCGPLDVVTPIIPHVEPHVSHNYEGYYNHMPACEIREQTDHNCWDTYFKFCVERNPWDKTISHYHMVKSRWNADLSFEHYLLEGKFPINFPKYTDPKNPSKVIVDEVLYYENLVDDLDRVFKRIGIPFHGSLGVAAKSEYRNDKRHYADVYTPEQALLVGDAFKQEIFLHGYTF